MSPESTVHGSLRCKTMAKDETYRKLIHTERWLRLRRDIITAHPLCQRCEEEGRLTPACEVHHIIPAESAINRAEMERLMYDPHNLRALCHDCHVRTHTEMGRVEGKQRSSATQRRSGPWSTSFLAKRGRVFFKWGWVRRNLAPKFACRFLIFWICGTFENCKQNGQNNCRI